MSNNLPTEKKAQIIASLAENASIRGIERMTGVHRDTIMRLGVRVGEACQAILDEKMHGLPCQDIQVDEIWGFIGKKNRNVKPGEARNGIGDVWTFIALDRDTKLVPNFVVGKRDLYHARMFMDDLAPRLANRVQISSDALASYPEAIESGFGSDVDYAQVVKTFSIEHLGNFKQAASRYSPADVVKVEKIVKVGLPVFDRISTSHIEKQNHTVRMHCRRLSRLTNAFSKKLENFKAAIALHFAYYNLCKVHGAIRCTPAQAAGVEQSIWTVEELVERCDE